MLIPNTRTILPYGSATVSMIKPLQSVWLWLIRLILPIWRCCGGLVDTIEERMDESDNLPWVKALNTFYFVRSQIVLFDTKLLDSPEELYSYMPHMSLGSISITS